MASRSPIRVSARAGESLSRRASSPRTPSGSGSGPCSSDTLHCNSDVAGSAVQFNRSVSAMPSPASGKSGRFTRQGTADTLLLRSPMSTPMSSPARLSHITRAGLVAAVVSLWSTLVLSDETGIRSRAEAIRSSGNLTSNLIYLSYLERTNPALLRARNARWEARERAVVRNGYRTIPYAREFTTLFPTNIDFRDYGSEPTNTHLWTMQTGLYGRHILRLEVLFSMDATWTNITTYEPPSFEVITYDDHWPNSRGPWELSRRAFTSGDWTNLVSARGDLSAIGFKGSTNSPIHEFDGIWRNLMQ